MAHLSIDDMLSSFHAERFLITVIWCLIVTQRPDIVDEENRVQSVPVEELLREYDYVIVGGGSAGAVLANRLSEDKNYTVLLLEAGLDEVVVSDMPLTYTLIQRSFMNWEYKTEPSSNYCLAMKNHQCRIPQGKVLGGSSTLNAMIYSRGNKRDYDFWASLGNTGWDYKSVLPYFKLSEDARAEDLHDSPYHQRGGYLTVEHFKYTSPDIDYIVRSGEELGYPIRDINGENQTGFTYSHGTVRNGLRCSTAKAFIRPASKRKNLHVSLDSLVEKILVKEVGATNVAEGVRFRRDACHHVVHAKREVIISAGAIQSPKLLMLSGIGPRDYLEEMKIPVVHHAPGVGQNLQDHVASEVIYTIDLPPDIPEPKKFTVRLFESVTLEALEDMIHDNPSPLHTTTIGTGMAFINTKYADKTFDYPDIQLLFSSSSHAYKSGIISSRPEDTNPDIMNDFYKNILKHQTVEIHSILLRPRSRGLVKLNTTDPTGNPEIYPNYFIDPHDLRVMIEGMKFADKMSRTHVMQKLNTRPNPNLISGCSQHDSSSDEYLACYVRHLTGTIYHPVGTCKMGPVNDSQAVVDARLRVYGIARLRVVDGSIMPYIVSGNTNAPVIMIAEKAADMIKEDWPV
ncbi:PREDICTED: glucose dehydrogenase [FAD, quinone]-like [Dinoponera quadriceps]|uniref:Glucose dehydrogenase [FAD, quinone]-like n=1 Tax=Dinoponera quadriceps TaxID=609295 RepID=A0A6P3XC17_DINQU|nr:PREDICTED: glucose dehydrogenase [FAD, quinone]-like [Dinoponera quadriceps]